MRRGRVSLQLVVQWGIGSAKIAGNALAHPSWQGGGVLVAILLFVFGLWIGDAKNERGSSAPENVARHSERQTNTINEPGNSSRQASPSQNNQIFDKGAIAQLLDRKAQTDSKLAIDDGVLFVNKSKHSIRQFALSHIRKIAVFSVHMSWDVQVVNIITGDLLFVLQGHEDEISSIDISEDGKWILTSSKDFTSRLWRSTDGIQTNAFRHNVEQISASDRQSNPQSKFVPSGDEVVLFGADYKLTFIDVLTGDTTESIDLYQSTSDSLSTVELGRGMRGSREYVEDLAFSGDARYIGFISYSFEGDVRVFDRETKSLVNEIKYKKIDKRGLATGFLPRRIESIGAASFLIAGEIIKGKSSKRKFIEIFKVDAGSPGHGLTMLSEEVGRYDPVIFDASEKRDLIVVKTSTGIAMHDLSRRALPEIIELNCEPSFFEFSGAGDESLAISSCGGAVVRKML